MNIFCKFIFSISMILPICIFSETNPATQAFNPQTIITISGTISRVRSVSSDGRVAIVLKLNTNSGTTTALVGPSWFVKKQNMNLSVNDKVTVTGSKTTLRRRGVIITTTLKKGNNSYYLRDETGKPKWEN